MSSQLEIASLPERTAKRRGNTKENVIFLADEKSKAMKVFCSLCHQVFDDPFIATCGHTFCHNCVSTDTKVSCPLDGVLLSLLVKNLAVAEEVGDLRIHCFYGLKESTAQDEAYEVNEQGCPAIIKFSERRAHEDQCEFKPVRCPNSSHCGTMLQSELAAHLVKCEFIRCPHHKYKCAFQGSQERVKEHLKTCEYEGVKGVLAEMEAQIKSLQSQLDSQNSNMADLVEKIDTLEASNQASALKIDNLEDHQSALEKELALAKGSIGKMMNDMKYLQHGMAGDIEPQHLFKCQGTFVGHKGPLWDLCKNGELLFSGSSDNTIKVWNLSNMYGGPTTLTGHDGIILALCTLGEYLFSGSSDKTIKVWNIRSLELQHTVKGHEDPVCTLACTENYLFSGSLRTIKVWDILTWEQVKLLPSQNHWVRALVVYGKHLYSGSYQAVKIWSLETLEVIHVLKCVGASVYSLAVTSKHIICGTYENLIHVWDVHSLQEIATLSGHVGIVYSLTVLKAPGKMRLFSASYDKTIRIWNMELLNCAQILARHEGSVTCVLASSGRVFSGAVDSTLKVWQ